jgi:hypothetical protein
MDKTITLPVEAQKHIHMIRGQMMNLQNQLQQFIDGTLIGMGIDVFNLDCEIQPDFTVKVSPLKKVGDVVKEIEKAGK